MINEKVANTNKEILLQELTYLGLYRTLSNILPYSSERTPAQYKRMRMYPMCWLGLNFIKLGLASVPPVFESSDEKVKEIVQAVFKRFWQRLITEALECLEFGWKPAEILWCVDSVSYTIGDNDKEEIFEGTILKCPKGLDPETVHLLTYPDTGRLAGFEQYGINEKILNEDNKSLVFTHMLESGHYYGISALEPAYPYWFDGNLNRQFHMRWLERKGVGILKGIYPSGKTEVDGADVDNQDIILDLLASVIEGRVVSLPSKRDDNGNLLWDIEFLSDEDKTDPFINRAKYIDESILRALIIPEKALTQGEIGARASVEAYQDLFLERKENLLATIIQTIDEDLLQPFVNYNFGDKTEVHVYPGEISGNSKELAGKFVEKLIDKDKVKIKTSWLIDKTSVPLEEVEEPEIEPIDPFKDNNSIEEKEFTKLDNEKKTEDTKMSEEAGRWRVMNKLENKYNLSAIEDFLDSSSDKFKSDLTKEINFQRDRIVRYIEKNYTPDAKFVSVVKGIEIRKAPIRRIFKDYLQEVYAYVYDKLSVGVMNKRYMASMDTPNSFIGFRIDLTGDSFATDYENALKYQLSSDFGSRLSKAEITDRMTRVTGDFLSNTKLENTAETELGFTLNKAFEDYFSFNKKAIAKGLLKSKQEIQRARYSAIMDKRVCPICRELDGIVVPVNSSIRHKYEPPIHYMCRCAWIPVTKGDIENPEIEETELSLGAQGRPLTLEELIARIGEKEKYKKFSEQDYPFVAAPVPRENITIVNEGSKLPIEYLNMISNAHDRIDKLAERTPPTPNINIPLDVQINLPENQKRNLKVVRNEQGQLVGIEEAYKD